MNTLSKTARRRLAVPGFALIAAFALTSATLVVQSAEQATGPEVFTLDIRECKGNPKGSLKAKTITVTSWPRVMFREDQPAQMMVGSKTEVAGSMIPYGKILHAQTQRLADGKVQLNFSYEDSSAAHGTPSQPAERVVSLEIAKVVGSVALEPNVMTKVHCRGEGKQQTWLEITLASVK